MFSGFHERCIGSAIDEAPRASVSAGGLSLDELQDEEGMRMGKARMDEDEDAGEVGLPSRFPGV